jgi:hypothetical protein
VIRAGEGDARPGAIDDAGPTGRAAADWLARCEPPPPAALAARVAALLGDAPLAGPEDAVARCVAGAERVVAGLLRDGCTDRGSALDLLAADALATYAFELAGERPESLAALADAAMARFAELGTLPAPGAAAGA